MAMPKCRQVGIVSDHFQGGTGVGSRRRLTAKRVEMDLAKSNTNESSDRNLRDQGDLRIETWPQPQTLARRSSVRIAIKAKSRILLIDPAEVVAVEAQGNYVVVQRTSKSHRLRESISTMEETLNRHGFLR